MYEFRPRPALWRLALAGTCQVLIAAWIAGLAVSWIELLILRDAGLRPWIVYAAPWDSVRERLSFRAAETVEESPSGRESLDFARDDMRREEEADRIHLHVAGWFAAGGVALAYLIIKLWPGGPALAARMFGYIFGTVIATLGVARLAAHEVRLDLPPAAILGSLSIVAGAAVAVVALRRLTVLLANVYERRARLYLLAAILPASCAIAIRAPFYGALLAACAIVAACLPAPVKFEQLTRIELREAVVPLLIWTAVLGVTTTRALVVREGRVAVERWETIKGGIPYDWPVSNGQNAPGRTRPPRHPARR